MDRIIYTAMAGAKQSFDRQANISNNLANVNTTGFREQLDARRAVPVEGDARLDTRTSVVESTPSSSFSSGPVNYTGRPLDVAMAGDAWLAVIGDDGTEAYTRRGDLQVDGEGILKTGDGKIVLGNGGPVVVPPGSEAIIGDNGSLSIRAGDGALVPVAALKLVEPSETGLVRRDDGLFTPSENLAGGNTVLDAKEGLRVRAGALEGSNVNSVAAMTAMISTQRMYEMQMGTIDKASENAQKANGLLSLRG